jgi:hypothetical protein
MDNGLGITFKFYHIYALFPTINFPISAYLFFGKLQPYNTLPVPSYVFIRSQFAPSSFLPSKILFTHFCTWQEAEWLEIKNDQMTFPF